MLLAEEGGLDEIVAAPELLRKAVHPFPVLALLPLALHPAVEGVPQVLVLGDTVCLHLSLHKTQGLSGGLPIHPHVADEHPVLRLYPEHPVAALLDHLGLPVDKPPAVLGHREPQADEDAVQQAVLLEAVAAPLSHHHFIEQVPLLQRQGHPF